ncbi:hypothetical protein JB92DRAFT_2762447 [Gautieria morchelliformis]|nr:hypothetical protein JB92DRAFT_2762447 [Gautieria morchelliformis]
MVYAPDYPDAAERQQKVRDQHLTGIKELHDAGDVGGALLSPTSIEPGAIKPEMVGSMVVLQATSHVEVRKRIESDIYWTSDVWDRERLVILPFAQAQFPNLSLHSHLLFPCTSRFHSLETNLCRYHS